MAQRFSLNAVLADPDEVQVVGENDVLRKTLVARDLIGFQHLVQMFSDCLVLDVTENEATACYLEIWRALIGYALGLVLNVDVPASASCSRAPPLYGACTDRVS